MAAAQRSKSGNWLAWSCFLLLTLTYIAVCLSMMVILNCKVSVMQRHSTLWGCIESLFSMVSGADSWRILTPYSFLVGVKPTARLPRDTAKHPPHDPSDGISPFRFAIRNWTGFGVLSWRDWH